MLYKTYIVTGEKAFKKNDLAEARIAYEQALVIKPNDQVATARLKGIEDNEKKQNEVKKLEAEYNTFIATADKFFNAGDYEEARVAYTKASALSKKSWPQDQVKKINKLQADALTRKKTEEEKNIKFTQAKQKEIHESNYNAAVKDGDTYFAAKNYSNATIAYNKALSIDKRSWPKEQIKKIENILILEAEEKRKTGKRTKEERRKGEPGQGKRI